MATAEIRRHWSRLSELGCLVCEGRPGTIHHVHGGSMRAAGVMRAKGKKNSDWLCIPLCPDHHTGRHGIDSGAYTVEEWEIKFGRQADYLDAVCEELGIDAWARAELERKA